MHRRNWWSGVPSGRTTLRKPHRLVYNLESFDDRAGSERCWSRPLHHRRENSADVAGGIHPNTEAVRLASGIRADSELV